MVNVIYKKTKDCANYMPQWVEIKKSFFFSNIWSWKFWFVLAENCFWIIIHLSYSIELFSMGSTNWNGEEKPDIFMSMFALSTKPLSVMFGLFSFQTQNPFPESKINKIVLAKLRVEFGLKTQWLSRATNTGRGF